MIVFLSHTTAATGFARVLDSIAARMQRPVARLPIDGDFESVAELRPDAVLVLDEPWACARQAAALGDTFPTIVYPAVDGEASLTAEIASQLAHAQVIVAFHDYGRNLLVRAGVPPERIVTIPHGVDTTAFHPIDKQAARRQVIGLDDAFVVLNANRNQPFKRIDLTIEAFAQFARDKPANVKLYLHMGTRVPAPDEVALVDRFGIRDRVVMTHRGPDHPSVSDERLNAIYNACDVGLNTSEKEGWGLIAFEHGATRAAQVVPRHSACRELWESAAMLVEPATTDAMERYQKAGMTVTIDGVVSALERLYRDRRERDRLADAAWERATQRCYSWDAIAVRWEQLFDEVTRRSLRRASSA